MYRTCDEFRVSHGGPIGGQCEWTVGEISEGSSWMRGGQTACDEMRRLASLVVAVAVVAATTVPVATHAEIETVGWTAPPSSQETPRYCEVNVGLESEGALHTFTVVAETLADEVGAFCRKHAVPNQACEGIIDFYTRKCLDEDYFISHFDTFFDDVHTAVTVDEAFDIFKSRDFGTGELWRVFFDHWHRYNFTGALEFVFDRSPRLAAHIPALAEEDVRIGSPDTVAYAMPRLSDAYDDDLAGVDIPTVMELNPVLIRYVVEAYLLEEQFGCYLPGVQRVLEVGGGYGGMASVMRTVFPAIQSHTIVDLKEVGRLQTRYDAAALAEGNKTSTLRTISSKAAEPVSSDLLISFFTFSELQAAVVDKYMAQYVAQARRGYIQLSYDEEGTEEVEARVGGPEGGVQLLTPLSIFRRVFHVQPSAVMLPPPQCHLHDHVRIVWGHLSSKLLQAAC